MRNFTPFHSLQFTLDIINFRGSEEINDGWIEPECALWDYVRGSAVSSKHLASDVIIEC